MLKHSSRVLPIEALNVAIFNGFSGSYEVKLYVVEVAPCIELLGGEFASVVDGDSFGFSSAVFQLLKHRRNIPSVKQESSAQSKALPGVEVD